MILLNICIKLKLKIETNVYVRHRCCLFFLFFISFYFLLLINMKLAYRFASIKWHAVPSCFKYLPVAG